MSEPVFRILLIEDNPADVFLFRQSLEDAGVKFDLTVIADGAQGLGFIARAGVEAGSPLPDLVVIDLNLPKSDGVEVLEALRANSLFTRIPVVVTSSFASPREQARAKQLGISHYIAKPRDLDGFLQLGRVVREILVQRSTDV